ncbi:MAG: DinB family protein [Terracidiphilus sp.]
MRSYAKSLPLVLAMLFFVQMANAQSAPAKPAPKPPSSPSQALLDSWNDIGRKLIAMAEDFPEDKYDFKPNPVQRSFAEQLLHAAGGNYYFINPVKGVKLPDGDPKRSDYKTKAAVVNFVKQSFADGAALIKSKGDAGLNDLVVDPFANQQVRFSDLAWGLIEHSGEHYGQLAVYYRVAGLVPPESRPKK